MKMREWTPVDHLGTCMTCEFADYDDCGGHRSKCNQGSEYKMLAQKLITMQIPEPGKWMRGPHGSTYCSQCGETCTLEGRPLDLSDMPYCPKCGAEMKIDKGEGAGKLR